MQLFLVPFLLTFQVVGTLLACLFLLVCPFLLQLIIHLFYQKHVVWFKDVTDETEKIIACAKTNLRETAANLDKLPEESRLLLHVIQLS